VPEDSRQPFASCCMDFAALTIFPEVFKAYWEHGILRRAIARGLISAVAVDIRAFASDRHHTTDDRPFGGGCGMVMKPEPLATAIRETRRRLPRAVTVLMTPQGRVFDQQAAAHLAAADGLILVCGRYEGVDERITDTLIDLELSIGDYVLTGGEMAALVVMDAVTRLIPGVLGGEESAAKDSFEGHLLEHAHYTRPQVFENQAVPEVLLSGNHRAIESWRRETALARTVLRRPDLLRERALSAEEIATLKALAERIERIIEAHHQRGADPLPGGQ
jgi:tRNA (guanine37-N1)-methyltransferase